MLTKTELGNAIKNARKNAGLTSPQLASLAGVAQSSLSDWENGKTQPSATAMFKLCNALNMSPEEFLKDKYDDPAIKDKLVSVHKTKIPILGSVACGKPIYANEEFECYAEVSDSLNVDFGLIAKGDSMIDVRIYDGDLVFIRKQDMVNNGEIAVVLIQDEATLKRVFYDEKNNTLTLMSANSKYAPFVFQGEQLSEIKILGKAVAFQSYIK